MMPEPGAPFCRDCLKEARAAAKRCPPCGSPRLLAHPERDLLSIAHVDCDAFFAAVEKRDDPSLADKPVIVGGGNRGVVSTACYVARTYGIRSAMPMFKALKACPHAVVIKPNMDKYPDRRPGRPPAHARPDAPGGTGLDRRGLSRSHRDGARASGEPRPRLARFARRVEDELGITVSIGLAPNKFLAKIASDLEKPRGFSVIGRAEAETFLADRPVTAMPGIGAAAQARLARAGVTLIRHLREVPEKALFEALGREAGRLTRLASGLTTAASRRNGRRRASRRRRPSFPTFAP